MATICGQCGVEVAENSAHCQGCGIAARVENPESIESKVPSTSTTATAGTEATIGNLTPPSFTTETDLKGIGGWLIPTVIALAIGPLFTVRAIYIDLHVLYGAGYQANLGARPGLALLILFEAMTNAILLFALIGLNVLFYRTRKAFPRWMITYLLAAFCCSFIDHLFTLHYRPAAQWTAVSQRLVAALIWAPYFLYSRRVKQTFVD